MTWKPDICIYHEGCDDGFGAAWAVWKKWGDDVLYEGASYGKPLKCDVRGKHVLMVDFSLKRPEMEALDRIVSTMVVLDHHKTAEAELAPWICHDWHMPNAQRDVGIWIAQLMNTTRTMAHFDMEKSGARLAWEFCFPDEQVPLFIRHIEDRDLWRFEFGEATKKFSAALRTYRQEFPLWSALADDVSDLIEEGTSILRGHQKNVESFCANVYEADVGGVMVPVVNVPGYYASDCADLLLKSFPDAPFAAAWFRRGDGMIQYSLRSRDDRRDVSEIAKQYGGGGHRNAAGFQVPA